LLRVANRAAKRFGPAGSSSSFPSPARADPFDKGKIMGTIVKKTEPEPPVDRQPMCDNDVLRLLADQRGRTVAAMATHFRVSKTAIRARLVRLMRGHRVFRKCEGAPRRSRPEYTYYITKRGLS
jgi:hypothetical protein